MIIVEIFYRILNWDKKIKYVIHAIVVGIFLYIVYANQYISNLVLFLVGTAILLAGSFSVHYPNIKKPDTFLMTLTLPASLMISAMLFLKYYPNLGDVFRVLVILSFVFIYYLVMLADNIFLIVKGREEVIPLYRVAVTWSLILIIIIAIPLFSGIFKLSINPFITVFLIGFFSFMYNIYQLWSSRYDEDSKNVGVGETLVLSSIVAFIVMAPTSATLFIQTEAFLRALFTASVLMFSLNYISSYLKNNVSKKLMLEYFFICLLFLLLLVLFSN